MGWNGILNHRLALVFLVGFLLACGSEEKQQKETTVKPKPKKTEQKIKRPPFNADSAYAFVKKQVDFGPRVPNTEAHVKTGNYLANKLRSYEFEVIEQEAIVTAYDKQRLNIKNIIGSYLPDLNNRVLLFAHWDTRPFADSDTKDREKPIDGANDGASGVGVLLEVARQLQVAQPKIGVDIIFFDAEDFGQPSDGFPRQSKTWCLGSQYWCANPHKANYTANFGILLDMVGAKNAIFPKEKIISMRYAPGVVNKVWNVAYQLGHSEYFIFEEKAYVGEDDHLYVNALMNIPSIDIIQYDPASGGFGDYHHTHADNMELIDKNTLKAVGETVLATVLAE